MRLRTYALALLLCLPAVAADDLVFSSFPMPIRTVVYEMPGIAAEQAVASLRRALPEAELIDGTSTDESVLRAKLVGPWMLVTILSEQSKLLRRVAEPLPLRVEEGMFHWGDFTAPAGEARVAFMGKSPFGSGPCLVYAAKPGPFGLSIGIRASYVVLRGDEIAALGVYDRNFVDQGVLLPEDAAADVDEFFATLDRVHPEPGVERLAKLRTETRAAAAQKARIRIEDLASILLGAAAALRDGHTGVTWRPDLRRQPTVGRRFPPFLLDAEDGRFRITAANDATLRGAELVALNGIPAYEFFRPALDRCSGETVVFRARLLAEEQAFWWWLTNLFGAATVQIRVRDAAGKTQERTIHTVPFAEYTKLTAPSAPVRKEEVSIFDFGKIAHWVYPAFNEGKEQRARIDAAIRQIRDAGATDLILDLRGNGGGSSAMGDYIFRRIWPDPVEQTSNGRMKLSPDAIAAVRKAFPSMPEWAAKLLEANRGRTVSAKDPDMQRLEKELGGVKTDELHPDAVYSGRLWLLVDNATFSAANMFAATFRDYGMGTILGHETGEPPISFGDSSTFRLKHSGIPYRVSTKQFFPAKPRPGDDQHGVLPDVKLDAATLGAFSDQDDPELAYTIDVVRRRQK